MVVIVKRKETFSVLMPGSRYTIFLSFETVAVSLGDNRVINVCCDVAERLYVGLLVMGKVSGLVFTVPPDSVIPHHRVHALRSCWSTSLNTL